MEIFCQPADITIKGNTPFTDTFSDTYFYPEQGLAESRFVFLEKSGFLQKITEKKYISVFEFGFGTGLNFLLAWQAAKKAGCQLHFYSVEKHPIKKSQLQLLLQHFPELKTEAEQLLEAYPPSLRNWHALQFDQGNITLTLIFDDAINAMTELSGNIDCWFLDGFSPSRNPAMWRPELFLKMAEHSKSGTTLSTFTAAGQVRRDLISAGFTCEKTKGFGHKREMLIGEFKSDSINNDFSPNKKVAVIGAGIAGVTTAYQLAKAGFQVSLYEQGNALCAGASGNLAGVIRPHYSANWQPREQFLTASFFLVKQYLSFFPDLHDFCGVLQLANKDYIARKQKRLQSLSWPIELLQHVDIEQASKIAGVEVAFPGVFFPDAGWFNPVGFCQALLDEINIKVHFNHPIAQTNHLEADRIIICGGAETPQLQKQVKIFSNAGQVSWIQPTEKSQKIKCIVSGDGYLTPVIHEKQLLGASYRRGEQSDCLNDQDHLDNLAKINSVAGLNLTKESIIGGRTRTRATTQSRLPFVGKINDNVWINSGHGSHGLCTTMLSALLIRQQLLGLPVSVPQPLLKKFSAHF